MAELLRTVTLKFNESGSSDVANYKLYVQESSTPLERATAQVFDLGNPVPDGDGIIEVVISDLPDASTLNGVYNLGIAAVDGVGNESSLLTEGLENIALDFVAPDPPMNASVITS